MSEDSGAIDHGEQRTTPRGHWLHWLPRIALLVLCAAHCTPSVRLPNPAELPALTGNPLPDSSTAQREDPSDHPPPALDSSRLTYVNKGTFGPYRAIGSSSAIALWATEQGEDSPQWVSTQLDNRASALLAPAPAPEAPLAPAPVSLHRLAVTPHWDSYFTLAASAGTQGSELTSMVLDAEGHLTSGPAALVQSPTEIPWLDAFSFEASLVAVWATTQPQGATLSAASLDRTGSPEKPPEVLVDKALAWQVLRWNQRLAVLAVREEHGHSTLLLKQFSALGKELSTTVLTRSEGLHRQVDAAVVGGLLMVAWTQRRSEGDQPSVYLCTVDPSGKLLVAPRNVLPPVGDQNLVQLVPPSGPRGDAYLVWETLQQAPAGQRLLQIAQVNERGSLSQHRGALYAGDNSLPGVEFVARQDGLAALTVAPACTREAATCSLPATTPTFVQFDRDFQVIASEPVRLATEAGAAAALAWDLRCAKDTCTCLAALSGQPVSIHVVTLRAKSGRYRLAGETVVDNALPSLMRLDRVASLEPLTDVASASLGDNSLVATLTHFDPKAPYRKPRKPAPDGRKAPIRSVLRLHRFDKKGRALGPAKVVSYRARATAGMQLLPGKDHQFLVLWSALDEGQPEVFATLVDEKAQRVRQRMLTRAPGEVRALAGAPLKSGYLVAWIDERDATPQVHSAPLTSTLGRKSKQRQLSSGAQPVTALALMQARDTLWLAQLEGPALGPQQITLTPLDPTTGAPTQAARVVAESARGGLAQPQLTGTRDTPTLVWLDRTAGELLSWQISATPTPFEEFRTVFAWTQPVTGLRARCRRQECRAVAQVEQGAKSRLVGVQWSENHSSIRANWILRYPPTLDHLGFTAPEEAVYYSDRHRDRGHLLRMQIQWPAMAAH